MNSRERINLTLSHREPDRIPLDLGGSPVTGMHVSTVYKLCQVLGLDRAGAPVKVTEPFQMLGEIKPDLLETLGVDVIGVGGLKNMFGFKNKDWKSWTTFDGTPVLVPGDFNTQPEPSGDLFMYPEGDRSVPPSGRMPRGGWYFDAIIRQQPIDDDNLKGEDNLEEFGLLSNEELNHFHKEVERLYTETDKAIILNFGGVSFGDIALVPGPWLKNPKGIRDVEEWYVSTVARRDFIYEIFERQSQITVANLEKIFQMVGNRISVVLISATDFGTQNGPFISPKTYRDLYQPFHKRLNDWVHQHTTWKTFTHSCGSIMALIDDLIIAGFDILNPVQCSAVCMDPKELKEKYGSQVTFWGGGIDTQRTLPFGTTDEVRREVHERIKFFGPGGGFVFNSIHNIQAKTPIENLIAMYETVKEYSRYPVD